MATDFSLSESRKQQLDAIVARMEAAGEEDAEIRAVVEDFKSLHGQPVMSVGGFAENLVTSGGKLLGDTASGIGSVLKLGKRTLGAAGSALAGDLAPATQLGSEAVTLAKAAPALAGQGWRAAEERYSTPARRVKTLYTDPFGFASDLSTLAGGAGAALKVGKVPALVNAGTRIAEVGSAIDPMVAVTGTLAKGAGLVGDAAIAASLSPSSAWKKEHGGVRNLARTVKENRILSETDATAKTTAAKEASDALARQAASEGKTIDSGGIVTAAGGEAMQKARNAAEGLGLTDDLDVLQAYQDNLRETFTVPGAFELRRTPGPAGLLPERGESPGVRFVAGRRGVVDTREPSVLDVGQEGFYVPRDPTVKQPQTVLPQERGSLSRVDPEIQAEFSGGGDLPETRGIPSSAGIDPERTHEAVAFEALVPERYKTPQFFSPRGTHALPVPERQPFSPAEDPRALGVAPPRPQAPPLFTLERGHDTMRPIPVDRATDFKRAAQDKAYNYGLTNDSARGNQMRQIAKAYKEAIEQAVPEVGAANQQTFDLLGAERAFEAAENRPQGRIGSMLTTALVGGVTGNPLAALGTHGVMMGAQNPRLGALVGIKLDDLAKSLSPELRRQLQALRAAGISEEMILQAMEQAQAGGGQP